MSDRRGEWHLDENNRGLCCGHIRRVCVCVCVCVCVFARERETLKNFVLRNSKIHAFVCEKPALSLNANETLSGGGHCMIGDYSTMDAYRM